MNDTLSELAERYRNRTAPDAALPQALANFSAHQASPKQRWPALAATAAVVCGVLVVSVFRNAAIDPGQGTAAPPELTSLSLSQLSLPTTPAWAISESAGTRLSSITRLSIPAPNLNQLSTSGGPTTETQ